MFLQIFRHKKKERSKKFPSRVPHENMNSDEKLFFKEGREKKSLKSAKQNFFIEFKFCHTRNLIIRKEKLIVSEFSPLMLRIFFDS